MGSTWRGKPAPASDFRPDSLRRASNSFRNAIATLGGHRLGIESDEHPRAEGRASRRPGHSQLPDLSRTETYPRRSVRNLRRQERIRGRSSTVPSGSQHGDGLEELEPTDRNDATAATSRRLGLATIVPLDAGQQTDRTAARVPASRGLLLAGQLATDRTAKLSAGYRG